MLSQILEQARELGLSGVLLSVEGHNPGSVRTIAKHGGHLERQFAEPDGTLISVYQIAVSA